ncbi:hypothetical protein MKW94_015520 [Papaver nudicaule]|uniref:DELLA protein n=1 Tax=Papaver nudicaule TaxID=74823 RepID=A0AA41RRF7_PAPNU|nr:hypothetical protein [Papaver nudicaule]
MGPYDFGISVDGSSSSTNNSCSNCFHNDHEKSSPEMDGFLPGTGYSVSSSEVGQVIERLEQLETVMVNAPTEISQFATDAVLYNPSNISTLVDSLLTELNQSLPYAGSPHHLSDFGTDLGLIDDHNILTTSESDPITGGHVVWTENNTYEQQLAPVPVQQHQMNSLVVPNNDIEMSFEQSLENVQEIGNVSASPEENNNEEDSSIRLVHLLMRCAESVQHGEFALAAALIDEMRCVLTHVNTLCGIGKVAGHFIDALARRVYTSPPPPPQEAGFLLTESTHDENEFLYHHFYEACPFLKFAHFTANQAILEAFEGHDRVHVIDFSLGQGLQWPALIQALALRPGGPPFLRLTGIGPPSPDGRDTLREIGLKLAELAWSVNVKFTFRGVSASRLDDVKPWMLQVKPIEAVAINSIMQLHRLLVNDPIRVSPIETVLSWIRSLTPKIVTVVEQEADHNQPGFLARFTEALYYYSTMFDSLETFGLQPQKTLAEMYIQKEISNVLSCEGLSRVERHEPLFKWRNRLAEAGFRPLHLGSNAFKQATMLLTLFSAEGYLVEENDGCLTLGWQNRALIAASAWQPISYQISPSPPLLQNKYM